MKDKSVINITEHVVRRRRVVSMTGGLRGFKPVGGPSRRRCRAALAAIPAAILAGLVLAGCSPKAEDPQPEPAAVTNVTLTAAQQAHIQLYTVEPSGFNRAVEATGTVDFDNDQATTVLAPISGPVARLRVSLGQQVKAGEPLAEVDSPDYANAISAYRKTLATTRITRQLADQDQELLQHDGVAPREAEQARIDATNAEADRDAALQELRSLAVDEKTIKAIQDGEAVPNVRGLIRSPIAGTVVGKSITPGQLLQAGSTPCFTIADLSRVWILAHVFGSDLASIQVGDPVEVETGMGTNRFSGTVDNISALVDPDTRSVAVRVVADNPGGFLKKQMYVRVMIRARTESNGLLVPVSAILRDEEDLPFVYVALADGSYARQRVTLGYRVEERYDITSGLEAGDRVVVEGGLFVQFLQNQ
jgi:cobalt-zinc-cadmium efflux system membrane fusion protein